MSKKRFIISLIILMGSQINFYKSQDLHFSMYPLSPLNINPALTGNFIGDFRANSIHRSQWSAVTVPYSTYSLSSDFKTNKKIPLGILINQDRAGDSQFNTFQMNVSSAFNLIQDSIQQLRVGFQTGITSRGISSNALTMDAQYNGVQFDPNLPTNELFQNYNRIYGNLNMGINYQCHLKNHFIQFDISCFNLNQSNQTFFGATPPVSLDLKWFSRINHRLLINDFFTLSNSILFTHQGPHQELLVGSEIQYTLAELSFLKRAVWSGVYYRSNDAVFLSSGVIFDAWKIGLAYDINFSKLVPASNNRGSFEIALCYVLRKKMKLVSPIFICPDYL